MSNPPSSSKKPHNSHNKTHNRKKKGGYRKQSNFAIQYIVWAQNGGPMDKSLEKRLENALAGVVKASADGRTPLLSTVVKV